MNFFLSNNRFSSNKFTYKNKYHDIHNSIVGGTLKMKKIAKKRMVLLISLIILLFCSSMIIIPPRVVSINVQVGVSTSSYAQYLRASAGSAVPDTYYYNQWNLFTVQADLAYAIGMTGVNKTNASDPVVVAVLDTGVDSDHPDLVENLLGTRNFLGIGTGLWSNVSYAEDLNGHGTHCAGIICADDNGIGVRGVAPDAKFYAFKVMNDIGVNKENPIGDPNDMADAINYITENLNPTNNSLGVDIISISLGSESHSAAVENAIDTAVSFGILVVSAAGNNATQAFRSPILYPARLPNVFAIGSSTILNDLAYYSQYTDEDDHSQNGDTIDFVAPGGSSPYEILSTVTDGKYDYKSGTSMACPLVAGIMALLLADGIAPDEINQTLIDRARDLGTPGYDYYFGNGLVQIFGVAATSDTSIFILIGGISLSIVIGLICIIIAAVRRKK